MHHTRDKIHYNTMRKTTLTRKMIVRSIRLRFSQQIQRLKNRLEEGLVAEIEGLIKQGLSPEKLSYYGLEYRYLTRYVTGDISYDEMFSLLNTAIHQFAKRQMTWFRRMERKGYSIIWLDGSLPVEEKARLVLGIVEKKVI